MAIDPERVKALFQAAIERGDPASRTRSSTTRSAATPSCATGSTPSAPTLGADPDLVLDVDAAQRRLAQEDATAAEVARPSAPLWRKWNRPELDHSPSR